jgi:hypothetical protein
LTTLFYFRILDSISSKLSPFVSGTLRITNTRETTAMTPNRKNIFSGPRNSCGEKRKYKLLAEPACNVSSHICAK